MSLKCSLKKSRQKGPLKVIKKFLFCLSFSQYNLPGISDLEHAGVCAYVAVYCSVANQARFCMDQLIVAATVTI